MRLHDGRRHGKLEGNKRAFETGKHYLQINFTADRQSLDIFDFMMVIGDAVIKEF